SHFVESVQTRTGPQKNILMLSQRLPWFGQLDGRERAADAEAEAVHYAFQARQLLLARMIGLSFYDYAYTGKAIELTTQNLALLEELSPLVEERVRTGDNLNSLLRLQVEIGKLRDRLATFKQQRPRQSAQIAALLALPGDTLLPWPVWKPTSEALTSDSPDTRSLLASVETNNPELLMLERKINSSKVRSELARLERRPNFTVGLNYIQVDDPTVNPSTPDAGKDPWALTFAINLPIWNSRTSAARREAHSNQRAAESELANRQRQLSAAVHSSVSSLRDAQRRVALYHDELLPLAQQALEISRSSYEGGRASLLEIIDSERSLLDLELQLWRAHADAAQQRIVLQTIANRPL
ncbi:MAG: TolC family protein, partial [Akkermansiaceae bacterium]